MSKKKNQNNWSDWFFHPHDRVVTKIEIGPYLHHLVLPDIQFYGFDLFGHAAMDASAVQTHKHTVFEGNPLWIWDVQLEKCGISRSLQTFFLNVVANQHPHSISVDAVGAV